MTVDDAFQGIMAMIESGGLEQCYICGEEKRGEKGIVGLVDENGREHTESVCYDCMKRIPIANAHADGRGASPRTVRREVGTVSEDE